MPDLKRTFRKISNVSSSKIPKNDQSSKIGAKSTHKNSVGNGISSAARMFYYEIDCQRVEDSVDVIDLVRIMLKFKICIFSMLMS